MFSNLLIISFTFGYLALLFAIAWFSEKKAKTGRKLSNHPAIYALSLAVYCTAWTYYGSVGRAATHGLDFLTIYIGPSLAAPLWWIVLRKIIRISKVQNISSIADFIASRYGKNVTLGGMVTILSLVGILPYIAIQIKAVSSSFQMLQDSQSFDLALGIPFFQDTAFYLSLVLAAFTILFGTRAIEATAKHEGMVMAVAFESVFKLIAFLAVGVFVSFFVFEGFGDLFNQSAQQGLDSLFTLQGENGAMEWFLMGLLSMMAVLFLPRQFQMGVIENTSEKHIDTAMWLFPLYLLLINLFVLPIAFGGMVYFPEGLFQSDTFVLAFPLALGEKWLAILVYLGGFSAATGMIIVSTIALSTMISNYLVMPILLSFPGFQKRNQHRLGQILLFSRRLSILLVILAAYSYYHQVAAQFTLVSIGLISFVAIAQFAPALIGGIYWKQASRRGAQTGILVGFAIWFYTLVLPTMVNVGYFSESLLQHGPFGLSFLRPEALLGLSDLSYISHGLFFSLAMNIFCFVGVSLFTIQSSKEHNQAVVFVDIFRLSKSMDSSVVWKGQAYLLDLKTLLTNFLGEKKTAKAFKEFTASTGKRLDEKALADPEFVNYSERLLSGVIGAASARILVASVVKEEEIRMEEVLDILKESSEIKALNKELEAKSRELKKASKKLQELIQKLQINDLLKDEFISTVTHEMKTPITSIRAFSEIIKEDELPEEERNRFLEIIIQETERMSRLIDQVLDLERFDSGKQKMNLREVDLLELIRESAESIRQVMVEKGLKFELQLAESIKKQNLDPDRIKQVLLNLLSNASKFARSEVKIKAQFEGNSWTISVWDDGPGIPSEEIPYIFDKFFQARNQNSKKPVGSGLGLAISKKIIESHQGELSVDRKNEWTYFEIKLPILITKPQEKLTQTL
ncbi:sensor histidine kinase [Algoriphagus marincola]|uniref:sensor histidine kinase n=1 Tax=Algoriphagus marincola TaxID=264027 RepID=UPI0003F6C26B|nr:sensor histidine kinase [Algoriphagus marincola]